MEKRDDVAPSGRRSRIRRDTGNETRGVIEYPPRALSDDVEIDGEKVDGEKTEVRRIVARVRKRMKEILGKKAARIVDIGDPEWVKKTLAPSTPLSLSNALRLLSGLESYVAPFSPRESRNDDVNEVLFWIRDARMRLLGHYELHPEYRELADRITRMLVESGAVENEYDQRIESVLRPLRELLRSVREQLTVMDAGGDALASVDLLPDQAAGGKLRERRSTAQDGSTVSYFDGDDPGVCMESFRAPSFVARINPNPGAKRVQSEAPDPAPGQPAATKKHRKTKRP
jgi:hypothetical protein